MSKKKKKKKKKRMPFGVSPAPEIFQEKLDQVIEGLEGVFAVFDDILIIGEGDTLAEAETVHDVLFAKLMKRSQEKQLRLHPDKLRFKTTEVPYVGHELTASGLKIDEHKVRAIRDMPAPTSVKKYVDLSEWQISFPVLCRTWPTCSNHFTNSQERTQHGTGVQSMTAQSTQ